MSDKSKGRKAEFWGEGRRQDIVVRKILNIWWGRANEKLPYKQVIEEAKKLGVPPRTADRYLNERLVPKGILKKIKRGNNTYYQPTSSLSTYSKSSMLSFVEGADNVIEIPVTSKTWITLHNFPEIWGLSSKYDVVKFKVGLKKIFEGVKILVEIRNRRYVRLVNALKHMKSTQQVDEEHDKLCQKARKPLVVTCSFVPHTTTPVAGMPTSIQKFVHPSLLEYIRAQLCFYCTTLIDHAEATGKSKKELEDTLRKYNLHPSTLEKRVIKNLRNVITAIILKNVEEIDSKITGLKQTKKILNKKRVLETEVPFRLWVENGDFLNKLIKFMYQEIPSPHFQDINSFKKWTKRLNQAYQSSRRRDKSFYIEIIDDLQSKLRYVRNYYNSLKDVVINDEKEFLLRCKDFDVPSFSLNPTKDIEKLLDFPLFLSLE